MSTNDYVIPDYIPCPPAIVSQSISIDQSYYFSTSWFSGEKEADRDIRKGRLKHFKNATDAIKYLRGY